MSNKITAFNFNAADVPQAQALEAIPATECGFMQVVITDAELKPTADGTGQRIALEFTIADGKFKGRKVWDGLNVKNKNAQTQEIAHQQLSAIAHAVGVVHITDLQQLKDKPFLAKIGYKEAEGEWEAKNTFKGAKPLSGAAPASGAPTAATGAPPWAGKAAPAAPAAAPKAPKPPAAPKPPKVEDTRKFGVWLGGDHEPYLAPVADIAKGIADGSIKADAQFCLEGEEVWKSAADSKITVPAAPAPVAPGGPKPPWAK